MSKEKRRVPKLRFPGFTEDWEQRKLSDISTKVTTKNVDVHYTETLTNSAEQGIISQVDFFDKEISNKDNINGYYIVENNDFIYNPRISTLAPVGPINRNKLNRTGIMSPLYTVFRASTVDLDFLEWYFQSSHWHRYMKLNGDSGARADRIAIKDSTFFDMPIKTPVNIKEQVLIGETLEKFNQYVTLHQRKLEHLNLKKKALLQKLFPKNGERYPELRFPGFTDAWEQRKFKDLFIERREKTIRENEETLLSCAITGIYLNSELFSHFRGSSTIGYLKIKKYDLILSAQNLHLGNANINLSFDKGMISPAYKVFELKSIDPYFINAWVKKDSTKNFFLKATTEGASQCRKNIEWDVLLNQEIPVPNKLEQRTIGRFINNIDMIITLHQRKLEHLQLQKKALLQQMFV